MTTKGDPLRFVVLSEARSGTSLLTETLNTHPEITCHGEVFHPNPDWHFRGDMADWSKDRIIDLRDHETEFLNTNSPDQLMERSVLNCTSTEQGPLQNTFSFRFLNHLHVGI